ncbi:hypothetical protein ABZX12_38800 [Kribbella sp. NPDC003505]|uniref:hypothetical protein n=1 Tax=Kribbella sp. NPDC003505 TaxID=3154448 RepID=UPI0033AF69F8
MRRLRGALTWAFVRGPAAAYALADSGSSLFGIGALLAMLLVAALGAGVGAVVALATGRPAEDAAFVGGMIGLATVVAYLVLMVVVVGILWVRGVTPSEVATGTKPAASAPSGRASAAPSGRHAAASSGREGTGWRRRGEPLVPGSLVLFFVLVAIPFGALGLHARSAAASADGPTAITDGTVVAIHEPRLLDKGSGTVDIRYSVGGADHSFETDRDAGDDIFRLGDVVPVEYVVAEPGKARAVWAVESAREDAVFWLWLSGVCAGLGVLSGVGYLVGRWRSSARRGG